MTAPGCAEAALRQLAAAFGEDRLLWATDADAPTAAGMLAAMRDLPAARAPVIEKVLGANAARLYRLSPQDLMPVDHNWRADTRDRSLTWR